MSRIFISTILLCLYCQFALAQLDGYKTYRQRADSCLRAQDQVSYKLPPQNINAIDANSYAYIKTYSAMTAQISMFRNNSTNDIAQIKKRLTTLIAVQKDMNIKFNPYQDMNPGTLGAEASWWYAGYMMHSYLYIKDHLKRFNINDPQLNTQLAAYETEVRRWIAKIDFTRHSHDEVRIFANLNYPKLFACYLATELWPNEIDAYGKPFRHFNSKLKSLIDYILYSNFHYSVAEVDATTYGQLVVEPFKMLAEYVQDPDLKKHAQITFQYLLATIGSDYNNGMSVVCPERAKGVEMDPNGNGLYRTNWLFYGFYRRMVNGKEIVYPSNLQYKSARENVSVWLSLPGTIEASDSLLAVQASKDSTIAWHNEREFGKDNEKKYVLPSYTIASAISENDGAAGRAEGKNNTLAWRNPDKSVDWLTIFQENNLNTRPRDGENSNARIFHHQKTLIGVYNVPKSAANASDFYRPFLTIDTASDRKNGYLVDFSKPNWVFYHTGSMMFGISFFGSTGATPKLQTKAPLLFDSSPQYFLLDDRKGAWILETAELTESAYVGKTRSEQLKIFRDDITRTNQPRVELRLNDATLPPKITYNSLTSGKLELQHYFAKKYKDEMKLNGVTVTNPFPDSVINSVYMRQASNNDVVQMGKKGTKQAYTIRWTGNSPPYIHPRVKMSSDNQDFTYLDIDRALILEDGQTSVNGIVQFKAYDPNCGSNCSSYDIRYLNGSSISKYGQGSTFRLALKALTKDTTIVFTIKDPQGLQTIDTVKVYVAKRPVARFDSNRRNQFLPTEKIQGVFIGKDLVRKMLDVNVKDTSGTRIAYSFPDTRGDSIVTNISMTAKPVGDYELIGTARSWIRVTKKDTLNVHIRNIVIQSPTPNLVLYRKNKTFTTTGAMVIPTGATAVGVQVLVYENGVVVQTLTATVSGSTYTVTAPLPSSLTAADKVQLVARMSYTLNGSQNETSYPVVVKIDDTLANTVSVSIKAYLQGAMLTTPNQKGYSTLMRDNLRTKKLIPTTDPYRGRTGYTHVANPTTQTITNANVLTTTGDNAIVDWVFVELRDKTNTSKVVATQSALIQRDGDVVSTEGSSLLSFDVSANDYYVTLRHRNHLRVRTLGPVSIESATNIIDFTKSATPTNGVVSQATLNDGSLALWAGDANGDGMVVSAGVNTDVNAISQKILRAITNTKFSPTFLLSGYLDEDIDLSGTVALGSEQSDMFLITSNVIGHPSNTKFSSSFVINKTEYYLPEFSPVQQMSGKNLVWNDEFNNTGKPNAAFWKYDRGFLRNEELQWYQPDNANCKDGTLLIEGKRQIFPNPNYEAGSTDWRTNRKNVTFTSSSIKTAGLKEWQFGTFLIRAKIDTTLGSWPAIWTLGKSGEWPSNGEIDILEFYRSSSKPTILANTAWGTTKQWTPKWNSQKKDLAYFTNIDKDWVNKFHIWRMEWTAKSIQLFVDDVLINTTLLSETVNPNGTNPFLQPHYMLLNLAIGANGGTPNASTQIIKYEIDYVRVYQ